MPTPTHRSPEDSLNLEMAWRIGLWVVVLTLLVSMAALAGTAASSVVTMSPTTIAAAGDIACEPGSATTKTTCKHARTARLITNANPAAVLTLGDNQYGTGALTAYNSAYQPTWGAFKEKTNPVPGNHEYGTSGASGYYAYYGFPAYYAYDIGSWRMYALNSNCDRIDCSAQNSWLAADIAANPRTCSLAYFHHARFSSGAHGNSTIAAGLWNTLVANRVDVALQGHDHDYERFDRMGVDGPSATGVRSFVAGLGGKSIYRFRANPVPGSQVRFNSNFGVLFLTLTESGYSWQFKGIYGAVRDSGSDVCI